MLVATLVGGLKLRHVADISIYLPHLSLPLLYLSVAVVRCIEATLLKLSTLWEALSWPSWC